MKPINEHNKPQNPQQERTQQDRGQDRGHNRTPSDRVQPHTGSRVEFNKPASTQGGYSAGAQNKGRDERTERSNKDKDIKSGNKGPVRK